MNGRILILDDEPKMGSILRRVLSREGYEAECTVDPARALAMLKASEFHVLLTDLKMPGMDGIEVLERAQKIRPECDVILMTAYATVDTAVEAMKKGARDYLTKPFANDEVKMVIAHRMEFQALKKENRQLREALQERAQFDNIVAVSKSMCDVLERVRKVAASDASVLVRGPSGTGKEILANAIHAHSPRREGPLIKVNCGALPETLLESELFGHAKGAFTGAIDSRKGLFETADGGTIFLDEIGEISLALQVKLLRILQEGEFQRVGESQSRRADVRVIAATNRSLEEAMEQGAFREDLYYRLNVVPLFILPLKERREDIPALLDHFLARYAKRQKTAAPKRLSTEAFDLLVSYDWPGNVRELENAVEHALVMSENDELGVEDLPASLQSFQSKIGDIEPPVVFDQLTLEEVERRCILNALSKAGNNHTKAAKLLGVTRRTLGYRMRKHGIEGKKKAEEVDSEQ